MVEVKIVNKVSLTTQQYALIVARNVAVYAGKSDRFIKKQVMDFIKFYNEYSEGGISTKAMEYYQQDWLLNRNNEQVIRLINEASDWTIEVNEDDLYQLIMGHRKPISLTYLQATI